MCCWAMKGESGKQLNAIHMEIGNGNQANETKAFYIDTAFAVL